MKFDSAQVPLQEGFEDWSGRRMIPAKTAFRI